ncbi:MAG: S46 family peptidase [Verrucomicrobia bacterium]|nr:S46 family peptidase [Verrucomicrobiota bacterium]
MKLRSLRSPALAALLAFVAGTVTHADEGMWLYSAPPRDQIKKKYGFELTDAWLEHLMKSSVRFNSGGSGSFVSGDGLVITNHHVGADDLQKLSDETHNYLKDGFYAATQADEKKCVDLELNVLQSIEDVTQRVNAAIPVGATGETAVLARRKVTAEIEKESLAKTGLRSDVVTLYQGGAYHLYRFKKYTDIRLVFAPEVGVAFFGGDPDNFEYPRYDLDVCFFRVYENGSPVKPANYLKWSVKGAQDGELSFVSGHPGTTRRLLTIPELEYIRDNQFPYQLALLKRREVLLSNWGARDTENARRAREELFGIQNTRKARDGAIAALQDPEFFGAKVAAEAAFKKQLADRADGKDALAAFGRIAEAQKAIAAIVTRQRLLEGMVAFNADSYGLARHLLRAGDERPKPNGERLKEYSDARNDSFEQQLFSDKPIYPDLEILTLSDSLTYLVEQLGVNDPIVKAVLAGKSPRARAAELINTTKVRDVAFRKQLYAGGAAAVTAAKDPLIEVARAVDTEARSLRKVVENADETKQQAQAIIGKARFAIEGAGNYPDATFTLRLSYGPVKGYEEDGKSIPAMTTLAGLYERSAKQGNKGDFELPERWLKKKSALDLSTPFNFVSTADIIGGNSGSPSVNRAGEFIGLIFDGNLASLSGDFGYEDKQARALSVHSAGILESLRKVYEVPALANELVNGKR